MSTPPSGTQGLGKSSWGATQWGTGIIPPPGPPVIQPLSPLDGDSDVARSAPLFLRFTDDNFVNQATLSISVGPTLYVLGGVAQNGATLLSTPNDGNGFDLELRTGTPYPVGTVQQVVVVVKDDDGSESSLVYQFTVGVGLRLIQVINPEPNILVAYYNRPLRQDGALSLLSTWSVTPVSEDAAPLELTEVLPQPESPDMVVFRYIGGGSIYSLASLPIYDLDGVEIDPDFNTALFEIFFPSEPDPDIRFFNSVFGVMGAVHQLRFRRTIDNHVISRSIAAATEVQRLLRVAQLRGSAGRDGRPGESKL